MYVMCSTFIVVPDQGFKCIRCCVASTKFTTPAYEADLAIAKLLAILQALRQHSTVPSC